MTVIFFCPQHSADFTKQSTFKSGENCALTNSDSISSFLKKGLTIFHQNIRGLKNKAEELMNNITTNLPLVLCFTEHH